MSTHGRDGIFEHQVLNLTVFKVVQTEKGLFHHYARNHENLYRCRPYAWGDVAYKLTPGTWFMGLLHYEPATAGDETSYRVVNVKPLTAEHGSVVGLNSRLWDRTKTRFDLDWSPEHDTRFMLHARWLYDQTLSKQDKLACTNEVERRLAEWEKTNTMDAFKENFVRDILMDCELL